MPCATLHKPWHFFLYQQIMKQIFFLIFLATTVNCSAKDNKSLIEIHSLINNRQYQKALQLLDQQSKTPEFIFGKALCYKALGDNKPAREILTKLVSDSPNNTNYINELASVYQSEYNWKSALICFNQLIELDSANVYYKIKKAEMLYKLDKNSEAAQLYRNLYDQYQVSSVLNSLGKSYEDMNRLDSAQLYYKKAWEYDFNNTDALANYIKMCYQQKDLFSAIDAGDLYTKKDSSNQQINRLHAYTCYLLPDYPIAIHLFERCKQNGDSSLIVTRSLGLSYFAQNQDSLAYENLKMAFSQDTLNNNVLFNLALACDHLGKSDESILYFTKFLERMIPANAVLYWSYKGLGNAYNEKKEYQTSIRQYETALQYASKNEQAITTSSIAEIYQYSLKDKENALKYYKLYLPYLEEYATKLKEDNKADQSAIKEAEARLSQLKKYINYLETQPNEKNAK